MISVVLSVVSHGQQALVERLVCSLDRYLHFKENKIRIVVTENTDQYVNIKSEKFPLEIIQNLRPKGFGSNHNAVFEKFSSEYFLIVNPDICLKEPVNLDEVLRDLSKRNIAISSPSILNSQGEMEDNKRANLTVQNILRRKLFPTKFVERFDWYAGMFLIVKSDVYRKLKGFDPKFFMYVEDCDLSMRARQKNFKLGDAMNFIVIHDAQRSSRKKLRHFLWHVSSLTKYLVANLWK